MEQWSNVSTSGPLWAIATYIDLSQICASGPLWAHASDIDVESDMSHAHDVDVEACSYELDADSVRSHPRVTMRHWPG